LAVVMEPSRSSLPFSAAVVWWQRPALLGSIVLALALVLNLLFW
jgi:hypothetical protein